MRDRIIAEVLSQIHGIEFDLDSIRLTKAAIKRVTQRRGPDKEVRFHKIWISNEVNGTTFKNKRIEYIVKMFCG